MAMSPKETTIPLSSHQWPIVPPIKVEPQGHLPHPCWHSAWLDLVKSSAGNHSYCELIWVTATLRTKPDLSCITSYFEAGSPTEPGLKDSTKLFGWPKRVAGWPASTWDQSDPASPALELQAPVAMADFLVGPGIWIQVLLLAQQSLYPLNHPQPQQVIINVIRNQQALVLFLVSGIKPRCLPILNK